MESKESQPQPSEKTNVGKLKKDGTPRACNLTDEQKTQRAEILKKGRAIAHDKRRQLEAEKKQRDAEQKQPVIVNVEEKKEVDGEPSQPLRKSKKKRQKLVYIEESSSSSSDEEVVVKRKKRNKKRTPSPPPPAPAPAYAQPPPPPPQPSAQDIERLRREKMKRLQELQRKEKYMASIFG